MSSNKYKQVADIIREDIRKGVYGNGEKIPSENQLANKTGFSRTTIRQATVILEKEGLIERVQGSGTYVRINGLTRAKSMNIGVIATYIDDYIFPFILQGITDVLHQNGYTPLIAETKNRLDAEGRILNEFLHKPIDGLIVEGTKSAMPNTNMDAVQALGDKGIPFVFFNSCYSKIAKPVRVTMDDREGGRMLAERLLAMGHRRIAGFFKSDDVQGHYRFAGFAKAMMDAGVTVDDNNILWYTTEDQKLLIEHRAQSVIEGCTAAICYNDEAAFLAMNVCGLSAVQWASFDYSAYGQLMSPSMISLVYPKRELGRIAAEKMVGLLQGKAEYSETLTWKYSDKQELL